MKPRHLIVVLGIATAIAGVCAHAADHRKGPKEHRRAGSGMHTVVVHAKRGEPAHGWRYFSDAREGRAVVISPGGDYFYSHGDGLELVYKAATAT